MALRTLAIVGLVSLGTASAPAQVPRPREVRNEVEGLKTILLLKAPGSPVKKGEVVMELDGAELRDRLADQEIATREAQADFEIADRTAKVAKDAVKDAEAAVDQEIATLQATYRTQELEVKIVKRKIADAKEQQGLGQGRGDIDNLTAALFRAEGDLGKTRARLNTMTKFTRERRKLEAEVVARAAESDGLSKKAVWTLEKTKGDKLRRMIDKCRVVAPIDGIVTYPGAEDPGPGDDWIGEGAIVRERQVLVVIIPG